VMQDLKTGPTDMGQFPADKTVASAGEIRWS
jgi:hypothetical protein